MYAHCKYRLQYTLILTLVISLWFSGGCVELKDEPPGFGSENLPEGIFVDSLVSKRH